MMGSTLTTITGLLLLYFSMTESKVIQSHWEHVKFKTVAPARVDARRSGEVVLECAATGSPAPAVEWYKDGLFAFHSPDPELEDSSNSLGETVARLRLGCVTEEAAGKYECRATSGKHQVSAVTEVRVAAWDTNLCSAAAEAEISVWRPTLLVEEGAGAVLPCRAAGHSSITWTDPRGRRVESGDRVRVLGSGSLRIAAVSWADMGEYTCSAAVPGTSAAPATVTSFLYPLAARGE